MYCQVSYFWNGFFKSKHAVPSDRVEHGFLAQEVEPHIPEVVVTDGAGFKALDYSKLAAVATRAVQEQQERLRRQEDNIARLRNQTTLQVNRQKELKRLLELTVSSFVS